MAQSEGASRQPATLYKLDYRISRMIRSHGVLGRERIFLLNICELLLEHLVPQPA